jgi:ATP-dependent Clp protease ATP-binding subunit ClpC
MFERFTERGREAIFLAKDEARLLRHNYIGTEHLLLGLIRQETGLAAHVLASLEITLDEVRSIVATIPGSDELESGEIPFTPRTKKVLDQALEEADSLGHEHVGTEHILLGLVREGEGVANQILGHLGADGENVRQAVIDQLNE